MKSNTQRSLMWLRDASTPMFVLNAQRRVVMFNRGCEQLSGWPVADILGKQAWLASSAEISNVEGLLLALAPPAEVWQGVPAQIAVCWPTKDQEPTDRWVQFWPIRDADQKIQHVLGIVGDRISSAVPRTVATPAQTCHRELAWLRHELRRRFGEKQLVGHCPAMRRVLEQQLLAQQTSVPLLLVGETGTGKETLARSIHEHSGASARAFVMLDARITPNHELKRVLRSLLTDGTPRDHESSLLPGTLFLANADELAADVQERFLECLAAAPSPLPVRLIVAAGRRLDAAQLAATFSRELACRLSPLVIEFPPLRERDGDLPLLAQHFLEAVNRRGEKQLGGLDAAVLAEFLRYRWPGNLDELRLVIEETHTACPEGVVRVEHLPFRFRVGFDAQRVGPPRKPPPPLDSYLEQVEREALQTALETARGNMTLAAQLLQIPRARLYRRLEQLGIKTEDAPSS